MRDIANSGKYSADFTWLKVTRTDNGRTSDKVATFAPNGILWGELRIDSSNQQDEAGANRMQTRGVVTLHQFPTIATGDRLQNNWDDTVYEIVGCRKSYETNETILDVESIGGFVV